MENETQNKEEKEKPKYDEKTLFLEKTEEMVKRSEKAVEEMRSLVERNEELAARNLLGGKSDAGEQQSVKKEETPKEYAKRISEGRLNPEELK